MSAQHWIPPLLLAQAAYSLLIRHERAEAGLWIIVAFLAAIYIEIRSLRRAIERQHDPKETTDAAL